MDITAWMAAYVQAVERRFGSRVWLIGLQGSRARGEAEEGSDIDVVLILDRVEVGDLLAYSQVLDTLPNRELVCGFVSGREELFAWEKSELFQFCRDNGAHPGYAGAGAGPGGQGGHPPGGTHRGVRRLPPVRPQPGAREERSAAAGE